MMNLKNWPSKAFKGNNFNLGKRYWNFLAYFLTLIFTHEYTGHAEFWTFVYLKKTAPFTNGLGLYAEPSF